MVPNDEEARLTRKGLAAALTEAGYPITEATLATMATRGGGPVYELFGRRATYRWSAGLAWAKARLSKPIASTSEMEAA